MGKFYSMDSVPGIYATFVSALLATLSISPALAGDKTPPVEFDRLEGNETIVFKSESKDTPKNYKPGWVDLAFLGTLDPGNGATPYFLFTGRPCQNCPNDRALLLLRPPTSS